MIPTGIRKIFNIKAAGTGVITNNSSASLYRIEICVAGDTNSNLVIYLNNSKQASKNVIDTQAISCATARSILTYENVQGLEGGLSYSFTDSGGSGRVDVVYYE